MKNLIIAILFLLPISVSAQLLRAYGVVEIGSTFPTSSSTGAKFAYRVTDSSFYRWVSGSTWVKVVSPSILPLYLKQVSGTTSKFSGDTINLVPYLLKTDTTSMLLSYVNLAGWGLSKLSKTLLVDSSKVASRFYVQNIFLAKTDTAAMLAKYIERGDTTSAFASYLKRPVGWGLSLLTGKYPFVDSSEVASRYYVSTSPTTIAANYVATSNGSNLVARNLFDDNVAVSILNSKPLVFPIWTTPGRPTSTNNYRGRNTTTGFDEGYFTSQWENYITSTGAVNGQLSIFSSAGKTYGTNNLFWDNTNIRLGIRTSSPVSTLDIASPSGGPNTGMILRQLANNVSPSSSYASLDFLNPASTIVGQFFSTASNYNAGTSLAANSIGLLAEIASGQLLLGSIGTGGYISFVTNNITTTSERMRILSDGKIGINTSTPTTDFQIVKASSTALIHLLTNTLGASTYRMIASSNNSNIGEIGKLFSGYGGYKTLAANDTYIYNAVAGNVTILNDFSTGNINFAAGGSSSAQVLISSAGRLSIAKAAPDYILDVTSTGAFGLPRGANGTRPIIASSTTPFRFSIDSTALEYGESVGVWRQVANRAYVRLVANSTWLKPQLEASNVNITTTNSLSFRDDAKINIKLSTGKTIIKQSTSGIAISKGSDASLEGSPITLQDTAKNFMFNIVEKDYTFLGTAGQGNQVVFEMVSPKLAGTFRWPFAFRLDTTTSPATIRIDHGDRYASTTNPLTNLYYGAMRPGGVQASHQFVSRGSTGQVGFRISDDAVNFLSIRNSGKIYFGQDSTFSFDPSTDVMQLSQMGSGNKEAADLSKTESSYAAWLMTDGTVGEKSLSTIRDGNGLYTGSGTLANHTTRALIPSTGNLLFSQAYNSTDSAYIQVINNLDGNREVRMGLTDTMSTGYSNFRVFQDEANETMGFEARSEDTYGGTTLRGEGGTIAIYADDHIEMRGTEIRLNDGEVVMNQYGLGTIDASFTGEYPSAYIPAFTSTGRVQEYRLARDTFIEDVTFSVGTIMYECQELTITSSMTGTAPAHQDITFPDAADVFRGKKIIVNSIRKDAGIYIPRIKVVGGVSRLFYTTNTTTTAPTSQAGLDLDGTTWPNLGASYEWTCLKIDNTPSYRWVLKQR